MKYREAKMSRMRRNPLRCKYCRTGFVLPRYRKGVPPTFKCDNCRREQTNWTGRMNKPQREFFGPSGALLQKKVAKRLKELISGV